MHNIKFTILKPFLSTQFNDFKSTHMVMPVSPLNPQNFLIISTEILYPIY